MNILIIGSGGRESAFAYKLSKSPRLDQLFIAPGNAGTGAYGQNVNIKVTDLLLLLPSFWRITCKWCSSVPKNLW
jgi:phosphoribosylamine-glycine ligase